ncbi:terminase family protein [Klebsiella aerogenes]|uniref:terminase large subunit domain-containing protein n=1 Tax=Klebsiella aerogenes TaxID=548 RepID=UPI0035113A49|nr:terminase family protein [Klebsiella aerogenes]
MTDTTSAHRMKVRAAAKALAKAGKAAIKAKPHVIRAAQYFNKFYKWDTFNPYAYQLKWFASGANYLLRYLSAANRIGKTYGAAHEFAYHATGQYPDWWNGYRCEAGTLWAVGISADSTRKVLQKELIGTNDARSTQLYGTGSIPRDLIVWDSIVRRGETLVSLRVKHISGVESEIHFYSATQDETVYMGQSIVFAWVDEQSEKELEIIAQCTTRTTTTGGCIAVTATPEVGATDFYAQCRDDTTGEIYFQNATWDDADHLTPEVKASLLARIPYYQRKMRSLGIPVLGTGAIYPYSDEEIICAPFEIPDHWIVLGGLDFGYSGVSDPSVVLCVAYDPETGCRYVFNEWSSDMDRDLYGLSHMPDFMARKVTGEEPGDWQTATGGAEFVGIGLPGIILKSPHDGNGVLPGTQQTRAEVMRGVGANVHHELWQIPPDLAPMENNRRSLVGSIAIIAQWFKDGLLKIFSTCVETMRELRLYQWVKQGQRTVPADKNNHFLDALRIAAIRVSYDGEYMSSARKRKAQSFEYSNDYEIAMEAFS